MAHIPINHHLRPLYRALAVLVGAYLLVYGIAGFVRTSGRPFFTQDETEWVLGLRTNPAFALICAVAGAVILLSQMIGRNLGHFVNLTLSVVFAVIGTLAMLVLQTDANVLAMSMVNVIVVYLAAIALGTAGLYDKTGTPESAEAEEAFRHSH
jgi:Na+/melibiose symporter-like transporter